jgi:type IV secretory pathway TrbD component
MSDNDVLEGSVVKAQKKKVAFATRAQNWVLGLLVVALLLVAQPFTIDIFGIGVYLLAIAVFLQIAVSNVAPSAGVRKTITKSLVILAIIAILFVFSIWVTPILVEMGR